MSVTENETVARPERKIATKGAWKKKGTHEIQLPSGAWVRLRIPDLNELAKLEALPHELRVVVMAELADPGSAMSSLTDQIFKADQSGDTTEQERLQKLLSQAAELPRRLIVSALVEPEITLGELDDLPQEDVGMLGEICQRQRRTDARGVWLGIAPISMFDTFRAAHGCTERERGGKTCQGCAEVLGEFSSDSDGAV